MDGSLMDTAGQPTAVCPLYHNAGLDFEPFRRLQHGNAAFAADFHRLATAPAGRTKKKTPAFYAGVLGQPLRYIGSLRTFRTLDHFKSHALAFFQGFETISLNGAKVNENIVPVLPGNKSIPLLGIKPFYNPFLHSISSSALDGAQ
jgi:hypothetical protein